MRSNEFTIRLVFLFSFWFFVFFGKTVLFFTLYTPFVSISQFSWFSLQLRFTLKIRFFLLFLYKNWRIEKKSSQGNNFQNQHLNCTFWIRKIKVLKKIYFQKQNFGKLTKYLNICMYWDQYWTEKILQNFFLDRRSILCQNSWNDLWWTAHLYPNQWRCLPLCYY